MIDIGFCQSELSWGAVAKMDEAEIRKVLQVVKNLGGSRVRISVQLGTLEEIDRVILLCREYAIKPLMVLINNPVLGYNGSIESFGVMCGVVAARYGPNGVGALKNTCSDYQLFNESNLVWNPPNGGDPANFTKYLKSGYTAIKAVHTSSTVIVGGTTAGSWFSLEPLEWYRKILAAGGAQYFDAIALHLYVSGDPALDSPVWKSILDTRALLVANGLATTKIWVTEVGVAFPFPGVTSTVNARDRLKVMVDAILSYDWMGPAFIYAVKDYSGGDGLGGTFGMVLADYTPKSPIYEYAASIAGSGGPGTVPDTTPPSAPAGVPTVSDVTSTSVAVTVGPSTDLVGVTDYRFYLGGVRAGDSPTPNVVLTSLTPGSSYTVYATALDGAGNESTAGSSATFTTAAVAGPQSFDAGTFSGSTVPTVFSQLALGFTVSGGVAQANAPTVNGTYYTVAPFTTDKQTADHSMRIALAGTATSADRSNMAVIRCSPDGTTYIAAEPSGGGKNDSLRIITYMNGRARIRAAVNATPASGGQFLDFTASGNVYKATILDSANQVLAELDWTDTKAIFTGAANLRTGIGWHHKRVGSVNYPAPGITGWKGSDTAPVSQLGTFEPWMLAVTDTDYWPRLITTGLWQTAL